MKVTLDREAIGWWIIVPYVLIDAINGFLTNSVGMEFKLSIAVKGLLVLLLGLHLVCWRPILLRPLLIVCILLLTNPLAQLMSSETSVIYYDIAIAVRLVLFFLLLCFVYRSAVNDPIRFERNASRTLSFGFWIVALSVLSGYLGFGLATYTSASANIGFKGYFYAGNELSALFVVLASFVLFRIRNERSRLAYWSMVLFVFFVGATIATKASLIFSIAIGFTIPLLDPKTNLFSRRKLLILASFIALSSLMFLVFSDDLQATGQFQRMRFFYDRYGIWALIFTHRDESMSLFFQNLNDRDGLYPLMFGYGSTGMNYSGADPIVEIDPIDIVILFGWPAAIICTVIAFASIVFPFRRFKSLLHAPLVLIVNGVLLILAFIAGHVWTSGMLAIAWALLNGFLWSDAARMTSQKVQGVRYVREPGGRVFRRKGSSVILPSR